MRLAALLCPLLLAVAPVPPAMPLPPGVTPTPPAQRRVGVAYTTWHTTGRWSNVWGTPSLGFYKSDDRHVIDQHARWLAAAGVDFVWVDWSNNIKYTRDPATPNPTFDMIEGATDAMFDEFATLRSHGQRTPNISIFAGVTGAPESATDGRLQRKVDQIYASYVAVPRYRPLVETDGGRPLLVVYVNTPSPWQNGTPDWHDDRFAVRWMTGYVSEQHELQGPGRVSRYGYWSWEDRGPQTFPVVDGHPEAMVITAAQRPEGTHIAAVGRDGGRTFQGEWARARAIGPKYAMVVSFNEWSRGEQPSAEVSKDVEPSREFGTRYLDLLKTEVAAFKAGR